MSGEGVSENVADLAAGGETEGPAIEPVANVEALEVALAADPQPDDVLIAIDLAGVMLDDMRETAALRAFRDKLADGAIALHLFGEGGDPATLPDLLIGALGNAQEAVKRCEADFTEVSRQRDTLQGKVEVLEKDAESHEKLMTEANQRGDALQAEVTELKGRLAKASKAAPSKVLPAAKATKLRDTKPMENPKAEELLERVSIAAHVLVFSDGEREIVALDAVQIEGGAAWMRRGNRLFLREQLRVKPTVPVLLSGFALFDRKGRQVAWGPLAQPLKLAPGQEVKLDGQVLF